MPTTSASRIVGSEDDAADATQEAFVSVLRRLPKLEGRDLAFGSYLFTSARHACYDLIERRRRAEPSDEIAEGAIPVGGGVGGGGMGFDPGDPEDDPERNVLLASRQEEIRTANATLPERQREVLVLRELENLSYDEIADIMDLNRNSVAQLISRARINLRDALRGTALASIATSSADCRRAIALLAAEQDRQRAEDAAWLEAHMSGCETCSLSREAMEEAGASYRAWLPVAAAPLLFRETMASAAEALGEDWSDVIARHEAMAGRSAGAGPRARLRAAFGGTAAGGTGGPEGARASVLRHRRLDLALMAALAALILLVVLAASVQEGTPVEKAIPTADETPVPADDPGPTKPAGERKAQKQQEAGGEPQAVAADPQEPEVAEARDEPGTAAGRPAEPPARSDDRRPESGRKDSSRERGGGGGENLTGDEPVSSDPPAVVSDPPADPPDPDPPVVIDPPIRQPTGCRDARGNPIPCPPPQPPGSVRPPP